MAVKRWLETNNGWLLIMDNADDPELTKGFFPRNHNGRILLTSRAQLFDTIGIAKPLELDVMLPSEAVDFFFKRTERDSRSSDERNAASKLGEELGYLPLALEQAGAYIAAKKVSFSVYLQLYQQHRLALLKKSKPRTGDYKKTVASTWRINFEAVEQDSKAAADVLRFSAFLNPDNIPFKLLELGASKISSDFIDAFREAIIINEVLEPLTRYSLIRLDVNSIVYSIHRLVQEVVKDELGENERQIWAEKVVKAVSITFPFVNFENWPNCDQLLPHAKSTAKLIEIYVFEFEEAVHLLNQTASYCKERAQYSEAESLFKSAIQIGEKVFGIEHPKFAAIINNLGELYFEQIEYLKAEPFYIRALSIYKKAIPEEPLKLALVYNNLGALYFAQNKYEDAESYHLKALSIRETELGRENLEVATSLNNLTVLYRKLSRYDIAEPFSRRALDIVEKNLGPDDPKKARTLNNLAGVCKDLRKNVEAEALLKRAWSIHEKALGVNHPHVATVLNNLAVFYLEQFRFSRAEPLFKRALTIMENLFGSSHPNIKEILENYAFLLIATNRKVEAEQLKEMAKEIIVSHAKKSDQW